jgi:GAF domain-containing protein
MCRGPTSPGVVVTVGITDRDFINALKYVHVDNVDPEDVELAHTEGRSYVIDPRQPTQHIGHPTPENEARRLQAIATEHLRELGNIPELNIVCDLAAEELGCFATMVTVIDQDVQLILGANLPFLREARFPRADTFCSHIIMDAKPLVVPHPEADIRFGQCGPVLNFGARYYCGFPLFSDDGTVLGSLCCVDTKTHELTAAQYATLQSLARTATKVVRTATQRFDRAQLHQQLMEAAGLASTQPKTTCTGQVARAASY